MKSKSEKWLAFPLLCGEVVYNYIKETNSKFEGDMGLHTFLKECGKYEPKVPNILYHYCSVDTMLKILQNYCIWLSDAEKTNDKSELKYFAEQMEKMRRDLSRGVFAKSYSL